MPKVSAIDEHAHLLGVKPDRDIAKLAGVSVAAVYQFRRYRGIAVKERSPRADVPSLPPEKGSATKAAATSKPPAPKARRSKLDAFRDVIGVLPDAEVARRAGLTRAAVTQYRHRHGTRPAPQPTPVKPPTASVNTPASSSETWCWRVSLQGGGTTHLSAPSAQAAAEAAQAHLGDRALGVERLGVMSF